MHLSPNLVTRGGVFYNRQHKKDSFPILPCQHRIPFVYSAQFSILSSALETAMNTLPSSTSSPQLWRKVFVHGVGIISQDGCLGHTPLTCRFSLVDDTCSPCPLLCLTTP